MLTCHINSEALSMAACLHNRNPTKAVKRMTPYEAWTGEKPKVDHLKMCQAFVYVPKDD